LEIRAYQQWLAEWDHARGWDRVSPSHTLIHAMEELGEVSRLVLQREGYKETGDPAKLRADLEEELADLFVFLFKLANSTGIDLDAAIARGQAKAEGRHHDLEKAAAELDRYHRRQEALLSEMVHDPIVDSPEQS
jgi:NTP pyrophosphatase (non-canonical NTP hydrolase)